MYYKIIAWPKSKNRNRNPFQSLLYDELEGLCGVNVVEFSIKSLFFGKEKTALHLHWPDVFLANSSNLNFWVKLFFLRILFAYMKARGAKVVWTAHNLRRDGQNNSIKLERYFWPWFSCGIDAVIYMNATSKIAAEAQYPIWKSLPSVIIPHGHYKSIVNRFITSGALNFEVAYKVLFFGSITRYKKLNKLFSCFLDMPVGSVELRVMGKMSQTSPDLEFIYMHEKLKRSDYPVLRYFHFEDRFLSDSDLVSEIEGSDLVVFPYGDVLNSGAAIFALSVDRPIYTSDSKPFVELQEIVGEKWVNIFSGDLCGDSLLSALKEARALRKSGERPDLSALDWKKIAQKHASFFSELIQ